MTPYSLNEQPVWVRCEAGDHVVPTGPNVLLSVLTEAPPLALAAAGVARLDDENVGTP